MPLLLDDNKGDWACKSQPFEHKNLPFCWFLLYHNYTTTYTTTTKSLVATTAEFNGLSFAAYRSGNYVWNKKILAKI